MVLHISRDVPPLLSSERDLKDRAHDFMARGRLQSALETYEKLMSLNDREPSYPLKHAEVCARLQRTDEAVDSYQNAARLFADAGKTAQAKAALNAALKLAPDNGDLKRALNELVDSQPMFPALPTPIPGATYGRR